MNTYTISREHGTAIFGVGGVRGCAAAHLIASRQPLGTLVLEADASPTRHHDDRWPLVPSGCDMLYLGLSSYGLKYRNLSEQFVHLDYCLGTHAYQILTEHGRLMMLKACLEAIEKKKHLDVCLAERMQKMVVWGLRKPFYLQGPEDNRYYRLTNVSL